MTKHLENRDSRAMRLAFVTDQFLPGDTSDTVQLVSTAAGFGWHGVDVTLVMPQRGPTVPTAPKIASHYGLAPDFEVLPLPGPYPAPLGFRGLEKVAHAAAAARRIAALKLFDASFTRNLPSVLALLAWTRRPVFYETYRPWPTLDKKKAALLGQLAKQRRLSGVVLSEERLIDSFLDVGFPRDALFLAHNGLDGRALENTLDRAEARARLNLVDTRPLVVHAGQIARGLGLEALLAAAAALPEACFALVGSLGAGPIETQAGSLPNVRVIPWLPPSQVAIWQSAADVLLIPPPGERLMTPTPQEVGALLAAGRAIAAPDTTELSAVLSDGENALLYPRTGGDGLISTLRSLLRDAGLRGALGNRARHTARARTWEERAGRILDFMVQRGVEAARPHRAAILGPRPVR